MFSMPFSMPFHGFLCFLHVFLGHTFVQDFLEVDRATCSFAMPTMNSNTSLPENDD